MEAINLEVSSKDKEYSEKIPPHCVVLASNSTAVLSQETTSEEENNDNAASGEKQNVNKT